ncbi:MAG: hypothetical protein Q9214_002953 [Letrouitia sp. 1 TL-2023]
MRKASKPMPPGMQPLEFLTVLATLDTANPDTLQDFLVATQARPNLPEPVPVGMHDGVQYFIKISAEALHEDSSSTAIPPAKTGDIFYGISAYKTKNILGGLRRGGQYRTTYLISRSPAASEDYFHGIFAPEARSGPVGHTMTTDLKYGFGLGRLHYTISNVADMEDTGFYVICNAVDKSIWVAFDFEPYGKTGEIDPVRPEHGDTYGELPWDTDGMVIGIMRLFSKEWTANKPLSLDGGDPFLNGAGTRLACKLVAKPAFVVDVLNAIKAGSAKPAPSESSQTSREPKASYQLVVRVGRT